MRLKSMMFALPVLFCFFNVVCVNAADNHAVKKNVSANQPKSEGMVQVDGISDKIVDVLWDQTDHYWHLGDYPRIVALDRIITEAEPHFIMAYTNAGYLMDSLDRWPNAIAYYNIGLQRNPTSSDIYYSLGMMYYARIKDYKAALATFKADVKNCEPSINDWKMLAHCYEKLNDYHTAYTLWQQIKKKWPNGPAVDVNLTQVKQKLEAQKAK